MKPTKVSVEKWGDGWKPLEGQCPWELDEPEQFSPEKFTGTNCCMNSQATSACEYHLYTANDGMCICMYGMTEEEMIPYWERMRQYSEAKSPVQGLLFPELEVEGEEIEGMKCKCGSIYFERKEKGPHRGVYCAKCGKWQRWEAKPVVHDPDWINPFGQYKGLPFRKIPTDYLQSQAKAKDGSYFQRIRLELQSRESRYLNALYDAYITECKAGKDVADFDSVMVTTAIDTGMPEATVRKVFWMIKDEEYVPDNGHVDMIRMGTSIHLDEDKGHLVLELND